MMHPLFLFLSFFFFHPSTEKKDLTLTINNIEHIEGDLVIALFNNGERFLEQGQAYKNKTVKVEGGSEVVVFRDLMPGTYAVSMYHDKNSNGKCDRNFFGIPKEPYAFSNNFKPKFSAPTFQDCEFELTSNDALEIRLIN